MSTHVPATVREGGWLSRRGGWLPYIATLAVAADLLTTAAFLALDAGTEGNALLVAGLEHGLGGGAVVVAVTQGVLLVLAWLDIGAVSTYVETYLVVTMGGGGLNNAVLLLTGQGLFDPLGWPLSYLVAPLPAVPVGFVVVARAHTDPAWLPLVAVALLLLGGEVVSAVV